MTNEMPKGGELSLNMMYQTSGTQVNMDYSSEEDFKKKFKLMCYLTPLAIGIFANSAVYENRASGYLSYRAKVWQNTARAGLPKIFLENMDFEKYADFIIKFPLLFIEKITLTIMGATKHLKTLWREIYKLTNLYRLIKILDCI